MEYCMRRIALAAGLVLLAACAKKEEPAPPPPPPAAPPAPAPINMSAVAGMWTFNVMGATSDSVLTTYTLTATADTAGWVMTLPNRKPMTLKVTVSGDSIMTESPEYESVLRKGTKVHTNSVFHMSGDAMTGTTAAHYTIKGADSVVMLRSTGTKMKM
jgi:hypothetical protein